jgi:uncharacterized protein DUF6444
MYRTFVTVLAARSTETTLPEYQSATQAVEPSTAMSVDWLTGSGMRARTVAVPVGRIRRVARLGALRPAQRQHADDQPSRHPGRYHCAGQVMPARPGCVCVPGATGAATGVPARRARAASESAGHGVLPPFLLPEMPAQDGCRPVQRGLHAAYGAACRLAYRGPTLIMVAGDRSAAACAGCAACAARDREIANLSARVERLERALSRNSGNSSMPPSADDLPGQKPPSRQQRRAADRAARKRCKQPGSPGAAMTWAEPDEVQDHHPAGS